MPFVYVLIFLIYFYHIQNIPIASSPPPLLPVTPPPPLSPRYTALQFPLRKEQVSQGYQPNRAQHCSKARYKSLYQGWMRSPSRRKGIPGVGKSQR